VIGSGEMWRDAEMEGWRWDWADRGRLRKREHAA